MSMLFKCPVAFLHAWFEKIELGSKEVLLLSIVPGQVLLQNLYDRRSLQVIEGVSRILTNLLQIVELAPPKSSSLPSIGLCQPQSFVGPNVGRACLANLAIGLCRGYYITDQWR